MIREYIIILSDKQSDELIEKSQKAGYDDDLAYLQLMITDMLKDDSARLTHNES